ncbi:dimethylaniline monooxygenase (N-oxide forming) [Ilyonectria destructans]|nr:dimethylaniline monooxygenase (N-oxide forming) [Ilyonectria destructans]
MPAAVATPAPKPSVLELLPGRFPKARIPATTDLDVAANSLVQCFPHLESQHFDEDALWRDSFALTGTLRTCYSGLSVAEQLATLVPRRGVSAAVLIPGSTKIIQVDDDVAWIDCQFSFTTLNPVTQCSGFLSLVPSEHGQWKIWVLRTILEQLPGHGDVDRLQPSHPVPDDARIVNGNEAVTNGAFTNETLSNGASNGDNAHFQAAIIGGGQSGLSTGGRLKALGVTYVVLEKNAQVGDAWAKRYESARLHTVREYCHLPFDRTFGPEHGEYLGKDVLARGHEKWAEKFGINIWLSTTVESGSWDENSKTYTLNIWKNGQLSQITANHIVIATGAGSQTPVMPELPDREKYKGKVLHSADYSTAREWGVESGIVLSTANTAHDVADDMYEVGMSVTMVQRNRTFVLPAEFIGKRYHALYNNNTPTELSDRLMFSNPVAVARLSSSKSFHAMVRKEPERYEALERAGFRVDPFGDIQHAINVRLGGHYIDVGTSAKIGQGLINVKSDAVPVRYTDDGLAFSDNTEIKADVIVFATGFIGNLRQHVEKIFGPDVAKRAGDCFGLNGEGEILGAFKPLEQPRMWYLGGTLGHARYYSRFIALSIKADDLGTPLLVYNDHQYSAFKKHGLLEHNETS